MERTEMKTFTEQMQNKHRRILAKDFDVRCDEGWYSIVDTTLSTIKQHLDRNKTLSTKVAYVKEKFGALRVVAHPTDKHIDGIVDLAYNLSLTTCESCGDTTGKLRKEGCAKVLCDYCQNLAENKGFDPDAKDSE